MSKFHKNKLYRVKEKTDIFGRKAYIVESAKSKIDAFLGFWDEYNKENEDLQGAIDQIKTVNTFKLKSEKVVYRKQSKDLKAKN